MAENNKGNANHEENDTCTKMPYMCPFMCQGTYCNMWNMTAPMGNMRQNGMWNMPMQEGMWQNTMRCPMCGALNPTWYNMPTETEGFHSYFPESN